MATFNGTSGDDSYTGTAGADSIIGAGGNDELRGAGGNDRLSGGGGNDVLNGGAGVDYMRGSTGNDRYFIFSEGEDVREEINAGTDTVLAGISYTLEDNFENLTLLGTSRDNINGFGNAANNVLVGNAGSNVLDGKGGNDLLNGGLGNDVLIGGTGNDRYQINSEGDVAFEAVGSAAGGTDTVITTVSYRAAFGIENINLRGDAISAIGTRATNVINGNGLANRIEGGGGNDTLGGGNGADRILGGSGADRVVGGAAADVLSGGTGNDAFRYGARDQFGDRITDFRDGDVFQFSAKALASGLTAGALAADRFVSRANDNNAQDGNDRFILNRADDTLWFDGNGSNAGGTVLVADLDAGATVNASDIFLF